MWIKSILQSELIELYDSEATTPGRRTTGKVRLNIMNSKFEGKSGSAIYDGINSVRMSTSDREAAISAMRDADAIVDAILWLTHKVEQLGAFLFMKHSIKH